MNKSYDYETVGHALDYETSRTNYLSALTETQKAKLAIGEVICLYGTTLEASEDPYVHVLGPESTVTNQFSQDEL